MFVAQSILLLGILKMSTLRRQFLSATLWNACCAAVAPSMRRPVWHVFHPGPGTAPQVAVEFTWCNKPTNFGNWWLINHTISYHITSHHIISHRFDSPAPLEVFSCHGFGLTSKVCWSHLNIRLIELQSRYSSLNFCGCPWRPVSWTTWYDWIAFVTICYNICLFTMIWYRWYGLGLGIW